MPEHTITLDNINTDFMTLWRMLGTTHAETEYLQRAFEGLAFMVVRYQTQPATSDKDKERAWTLLETMQIQYDAVMAVMGWRMSQDIIDIVLRHVQ